MNATIKNDSIWLDPIPQFSKIKAIKVTIPKLETKDNTGHIFGDIVEGREEYQLPENCTADDVTNIELILPTI